MSSSKDQSCSCAADEQKMLAPVLASINLNPLPRYASRIRQQYHDANCHENPAATITCIVLLPPLCGSYHVLFPLEFTDGLRWIIKIPITGYHGRYDEISARALKSEAFTMRLLKRETTIPIPEVYSFDASMDNELNCPYILMEFVHGISLCDIWLQPSSSLVSIEQFRANVLKDVAEAMVQLNKFTYNQSGSLLFDDDGNVTGNGPAKVFDGPAFSESLFKDDCNDLGFFFENGPFDDPRLCFLSALERHAEPDEPDAKLDHGATVLLKLFINWVPIEGSAQYPGFVLKHPDLDAQNILVSKEGHLQGIIDWDGVAAAPRCIGCEQYPLWLTRDWNPHQYYYNSPDPDNPQHSPEELAYYRSMYAGFMDLCLAEKESKSSIQVKQGTASADSCFETPLHYTRRSLLVQSLELASIDPVFTLDIVDKIFELIEEITATEYDGSHLEDDMQNERSGEFGSARTESTSFGRCDSDEESSEIVHHAGEDDTLAHQSFDEEGDRNDSTLSPLMKTNMMTSEKVHDDYDDDEEEEEEDDDTVAHQSFNKGLGDDYASSSFLFNTFSHLSNTQDKSRLILLAYHLLDQVENTAKYGASKDAEVVAQKIDELLGCEIGQKLQDLRDLIHEHRAPIMRSIATLCDYSKAKVIPSRSEQDGLDGKDGFSPRIQWPADTFEVVDGESQKRDSEDSASAASTSNKPVFFGKIAGSDKQPAAELKSKLNGVSFGPWWGHTDEKLARADIYQKKMGAFGDNADTATGSNQEEKQAVCDNANISADSIQGEMITASDDANTSKGTTNVSDENTEEVVNKADLSRVHSLRYEDVGFSFWEVTHALADGVLDADRMLRLKNGFLALLASLEDESAVPSTCSGIATA